MTLDKGPAKAYRLSNRSVRLTGYMRRVPADPRTRILQAATHIFAQHGYAGARVDDIAREAGVNKAMVYYHVGDKDHLYATVIGEVIDRALGAMQPAIAAAPSPEQKLRSVIRVIGETATANPALPPLILREIAAGGAGIPEFALRKMAEVFRTVGMILRDGARAGAFREVDPVITHMLIAGSVFLLVAGAPLRKRLRALKGIGGPAFREGSTRELADALAELFLSGLHNTTRPGGR